MDLEKLNQTIGGVFALMACIKSASNALGLTNEQIMAFCDATPNGEELWKKFTAKRDSPDTPEDYNFISFMTEILANIDQPKKVVATRLHALPYLCVLPQMQAFVVSSAVLPKLKEVMTDEEIVAASESHQPELDKMRAVACRGCSMLHCEMNFRFRPPGFEGLMDQPYKERCERGEALLATLLPKERRSELELEGIDCYSGYMPSRKNPLLWFSFEKEGQKQWIDCQVGRATLRVNGEKKEPLVSTSQLSDKINDAVEALL